MPVAYLTIDDAPSADFEKKVAFLRAHRVPAVFFCIGEQLTRYPDAVVNAIRDGFVIGNHSYSHPRFSQLSLDEAKREIDRTDTLLEHLHEAAGRKRPVKLFRFPYGDTGRHTRAIRRYLAASGHVGIQVPRPRLVFPFLKRLRFGNVDSWWTFDLREWCLARLDHAYPIRSPQDVFDRLERELSRTRWRVGSDHVFLAHDHVETAAVFCQLVQRLLAHRFTFGRP